MRFSFQSGSSSKFGSNFPKQKGEAVKRARRCLNCSRDMQDDGTVAFLRGFCSNKCMQSYVGYSDPVRSEPIPVSREGFL